MFLFVNNEPIGEINQEIFLRKTKKCMDSSSMVSVAALNPRDPGSNPGWFAVSNSTQNLSFHK